VAPENRTGTDRGVELTSPLAERVRGVPLTGLGRGVFQFGRITDQGNPFPAGP
jgi:hypothetical protein